MEKHKLQNDKTVYHLAKSPKHIKQFPISCIDICICILKHKETAGLMTALGSQGWRRGVDPGVRTCGFYKLCLG